MTVLCLETEENFLILTMKSKDDFKDVTSKLMKIIR